MKTALLAVLAACGRVGFESGGEVCDAAIGHDEDRDGVDDACDSCPHLPGAQLDRDGDGIGDVCDPEPDDPRQRLALFATMRPDDQPFGGFISTTGVWSQHADSFDFDGVDYGGLVLALPVENVVLSAGITVVRTIGADLQHQLEILATNADTTFVEVGFNGTGSANVPAAAIAYWDGSAFAEYRTMETATGLHAGAITIIGTYRIGESVVVDAGWAGEPYHVELAPFDRYLGAATLQLDSNNVAFAVDWMCAIAW